MLGIKVDRTSFLWKPLSKRVKRVLVLPLSLITMVAVVFTAFAYSTVSSASGSAAAEEVGVTQSGTWTCSFPTDADASASILASPLAADGRGVDVSFDGVNDGDVLRCTEDWTNDLGQRVCHDLTPNSGSSIFGGEATLSSFGMGVGHPGPGIQTSGFEITFSGVTESAVYGAQSIGLDWGFEADGFGDGNVIAGDDSCAS